VEKKLFDMGEVAYWLCHDYKSSVIQKIHTPVEKNHTFGGIKKLKT